ncbi:hypothetical protein GCM10023205_52560 [Yinghuangia aomiensis]|uniref:Uncharacterized protein n=1 Tax=Yinghuangia aomiensis TaxID=676205 RepID=A0ABP9HUJ4_9ACTN
MNHILDTANGFLLVIGGLYLLFCRFFPYATCPGCEGTGRPIPGASCRRCGNAGVVLRRGHRALHRLARLVAHIVRVHREGARRKEYR